MPRILQTVSLLVEYVTCPDLAAMQKLYEASTQGEWYRNYSSQRGFTVWAPVGTTGSMQVAATGHAETFDLANTEFIVAAHNAWLRMFSSLVATRAERDEIKKRFDLWFGDGSCDVCGGAPLASGRKCVCGGQGTRDAEHQGLREAWL